MDIELRDIDKITPYEKNPRLNDDAVDAVAESIREFGFRQPVVVDGDGVIICGHTRWKAAKKLQLAKVPVHVVADLTPEQVKAYRIADNKTAELAEWDFDQLRIEIADLQDSDFDLDVLAFDDDELTRLLSGGDEVVTDGQTDPDSVPESPDEAVSVRGEVYALGEHRLMCGDSTNADDVARLMNGEMAVLLHADPPYGMGKEKEGVENDNLYRDELDVFQMQWWVEWRKHLGSSSSVYIWGRPESLWRLWYCGGLANSERMTFRNEIVWDKESGGQGVGTEAQRCYFPTERCLFFMLGQQGFNANADNYWGGWEPIRAYLKGEMKRAGWTGKDLNRITGTQMAKHWVTKSQWSFITADHYAEIQQAARDHDAFEREYDALKREYDALKRDYDALKREFYASRAYFDNMHDKMTDVWKFSRVTGEDRQGHATPKPVDMICRCIKSSSQGGAIVAEPFLGSGTTVIACERLGRSCFGMEISPIYCDVIRKRWAEFVHGEGCDWQALTPRENAPAGAEA